jgi:hypothetical protein
LFYRAIFATTDKQVRVVVMVTSKNCLILFLFLQFTGLQAQNGQIPLLEREVTISAQNQTIESVLNLIGAQSGIIFSYSPEIIHSNSKVSLSVKGKSVRFAINSLFSNNITCKVKGEYVILKEEGGKHNGVADRTIEGYIYDSGTGEKLTDVSVYDKDLTASAVTDKYGYFRMEIPDITPLSSIQVSKLGYSDTTCLELKGNSMRTLEIALNSDERNKNSQFFTFQKIAPLWLVPRHTMVNSFNISKSAFKAVQFSFLPTISTNRFLRGNTVNKVSINLLAGYVQGVRLVEIGGLINIVKEDAQYAQFGGIGNVVGNNFKGFQVAGIFNTSRNVKGVQAAGIFSSSMANADFQVSGVYNYARAGNSQTSGILNIAREMKLQIAGIANTAEKSVLQIAGILNLASDAKNQTSGINSHSGNVTFLQISGIVNSASAVNGLQLTGCFNYARNSANVQIAGLFNRAGYVRTLQLSVLNLADSCNGISVGLFSYVKNGYHKLEVSADEIFPFNASFRSGVKQFHTLVMIGINPFGNARNDFHFGYGIGTSFGKTGKLLFDIDLTNREIFSNNDLSFNNHLYQVYTGIDRLLSPKLSIAAGLTFNYLLSNNAQAVNSLSATLPPYEISSNSFSNGSMGKSWFGVRIAIRFW